MQNASQAERQLGLRIHAIAFVPSIIVLVVINLFAGASYWVLWVLLGWGSGFSRTGCPFAIRPRASAKFPDAHRRQAGRRKRHAASISARDRFPRYRR
ncbi:2TM domain-containing protein (plasmid) [Neorhizobium galegae]|nr:2TM domain-containing protein [Neorhizobium galegae]